MPRKSQIDKFCEKAGELQSVEDESRFDEAFRTNGCGGLDLADDTLHGIVPPPVSEDGAPRAPKPTKVGR